MLLRIASEKLPKCPLEEHSSARDRPEELQSGPDEKKEFVGARLNIND